MGTKEAHSLKYSWNKKRFSLVFNHVNAIWESDPMLILHLKIVYCYYNSILKAFVKNENMTMSFLSNTFIQKDKRGTKTLNRNDFVNTNIDQ